MDMTRRPVGRPRKPRSEEDEAKERYGKHVPTPPEVKQPVKLPKWDGKTRGPTLGKTRPDGKEWHSQTHKWWRVWRRSPQAMFFEASDWESMFVSAMIYDQIMWGCSHTALGNLSGELRKRESQIGASIEDRIRLGMQPDQPNEAVQEAQIQKGVQEVVDYAARLNERVQREST